MVGHCFEGDEDDGKDENEDGDAGKRGHKPALIHLHSPTEQAPQLVELKKKKQVPPSHRF